MSSIEISAAALPTDTSVDASAKGHPKGLYVLFATEMWERFSFYGMRSLLVLYLVSYLQWAPGQAQSAYKWYTSLVYLTPLIGGFLADRYLGLRKSILIGGFLMAIGHFLLAFEPLPIFYTALVFLILGCGLFKPNISTLVGKMYHPNDARRDSAYSIFYMGVNTGAFLSPLVCGWLRIHYGFHYGFAAAGVGMVFGLIVFAIYSKHVMSDVAASGNTAVPMDNKTGPVENHPDDPSESQPGAGGLTGSISSVFPYIMFAIAVLVPAQYMWKLYSHQIPWYNTIVPCAFALLGGMMGRNLQKIKGAARNKSTAIFVIFVFAVLFWMAFEQAGGALNLWAEYNTKQSIGSLNTTAEWYQSVNSIFIITLAPVFGFMWVWLAKRGREIRTGYKVFASLLALTLGYAGMTAASKSEDSHVSTISVSQMPSELRLVPATTEQSAGIAAGTYSAVFADEKKPEPINAGRVLFNSEKKELIVRGTLPPFVYMDLIRPTVNAAYVAAVEKLVNESGFATAQKPTVIAVSNVPSDFNIPKVAGLTWKAETSEFIATASISPVDQAKLIGAGAPVAWKQTIDKLQVQADEARVSGWWLVLFYLLATISELCISPVGLSLVSKLAPARFAALFMGFWFLATSVGEYVGGSLGELWGQVTPVNYFWEFVLICLIGAIALIPLFPFLRKLMHEIK